MELSERDRAILDFERTSWQRPGSKEAAIREHLGISGTRYYQLIGAIVDGDAALTYDPLTVRRLRRLREQRRDRLQAGHADPGTL